MNIGGYTVGPEMELTLRRAAKEERDLERERESNEGDWQARCWTVAHDIQRANQEMLAQIDVDSRREQLALQRAADERAVVADDRRQQLLMSGVRPHSVADVLWPDYG